MCHTFVEVKTSKHLILLSVLCAHTGLSDVMHKYSNAGLCCLNTVQTLPSNNLNQVNQQGNRSGILILITLCAWKHVIYFITGEHIPGDSNAAMPSDGGVCTYGMSEVQRLTNEPMGLQSIHLIFKYLSFSTVHCP